MKKICKKNFCSSSFVIVGLARNCGKVIAEEIKRIHSAFDLAKKVNWIIIESDSSDNTLSELDILKNQYQINLISLGSLRQKFKNRTERIAFCRNVYLTELRENISYSKTDFVVVADLDGVNNKLNKKSIQACWETDVEWDACFANQVAPYYDIWALRHKTWCPNDCWEQANFLKSFGIHASKAERTQVYSKMIKISTNCEPIAVDSAFGGIGIYKYSCILKGKYLGIGKNGKQLCEHVSFNKSLRKQGKLLVIIPKFINGSWNDNNKRSRNLNLINAEIKSILFFIIKKFFFKIIKISNNNK